MPDSINRVGDGVFKKCSSLGYLSFPYYLNKLRLYVFEGCALLKQIEIPSKLFNRYLWIDRKSKVNKL